MNELVDSLSAWSEAWAAGMWAVVWQSTLVAGVIALVAWVLRRSSPAARYWLWQIVAVKLLVMPFWAVAVPLPGFWSERARERPDVSLSGGPAVGGDGAVAPRVDIPLADTAGAADAKPSPGAWLKRLGWRTWLCAAWVLGIVWQIGAVARQRVRLARVLRKAAPAEARVTELVRDLAVRMGLKRVPRVVVSGTDGSPFVCGMRRPMLVLPKPMLGSLDEGQLRQVLLHELAHVKRHDLAWGWISEVARLVYFFHPVAHLASYRIRLERELACDQTAMALSGADAAGYAETLVQVVSRSSEPAALRAGAITSAGLAGEAVSSEKSNLDRSRSDE